MVISTAGFVKLLNPSCKLKETIFSEDYIALRFFSANFYGFATCRSYCAECLARQSLISAFLILLSIQCGFQHIPFSIWVTLL